MAAEGVAGIGRVHDHPAAAQGLDRLAHEAPLRRDRMQLQIDTHVEYSDRLPGYDTRMNQLLEFLPLIVFLVCFELLGIYWATAALMLACVVQLAVHRLRTGKFKPMHVVTVAVVLPL